MAKSRKQPQPVQSFQKEEVLNDYQLAVKSRAASLIGRREVLSGKAKFGIFGDGKELAQIAMAKSVRHGDWRSGYYRDQTLMFALGASDFRQFFAQLYADTDLEREPASGGRQMNSHYASRYRSPTGVWLNQLMMHNTAADASPTAAQMGRLLGLAYASKIYRQSKELQTTTKFSLNGNEVAFGTIGNASTSEGIFFETVNAAGVLGVPLVISVWDDDYGISVPNKFQTTKESISRALKGFQREHGSNGLEIFEVLGYDYPQLIKTYQRAAELARREHVPVLVHVTGLTQPQGHSTSGSHERYKSAERLKYEVSEDCIVKFRDFIVDQGLASAQELEGIAKEAEAFVEEERQKAWLDYIGPIQAERDELIAILEKLAPLCADSSALSAQVATLGRSPNLNRRLILSQARRALVNAQSTHESERQALRNFIADIHSGNDRRYHSCQLSEFGESPLRQQGVAAQYSSQSELIDGRQVIQRLFDHHLATDPRVFIVGEDIGKLGGVNLEFDGLSDKHGSMRVTDTGIREATILGQGLGAAMRGLRPIVDIQYLDYLLYCFQLLSDDLATLHYRSAGGQSAPCIVRTKGHRLEGIWHTGSPMGMIVHGLRGMHVCVPRNMVQAAGFYNTLLKGDDPALVIEVLNGYRLKEKVPDNLSEYCLALGVPEILRSGKDVTVVTYGASVRVVEEAAELLAASGIDIEIIDVQTLLPFDIHHSITASIRKTHAVLFVDEDVPGGASAYMMQEVLETQNAYDELDAKPATLSAKAHRSPYGSDGDYATKPSADDVFEAVYALMHEQRPQDFPAL